VFLGASTEATEVCTSEVTSPTLVEGCVLRFAKVVLDIVRDVRFAYYEFRQYAIYAVIYFYDPN
jgi:hypothetical protein